MFVVLIKFLKKYLKVIVFAASILVSALIFIFRDRLMGLSGYGLLGVFLISLVGASTILVPVPIYIAAFVAGAIFNPALVAITASLGASIGEMTGYMVGYGAEDIINKEVKLQRIKKWTDKYGLWVIFLLAVIPNPFFDLAGIVSGASEVPIHKFLLVTWLGKLMRFGVIAYLGANSITLIDKFI